MLNIKYLSSTYSCIAGHKWTVCTRCSCCWGKLMGNWFAALILSNKVYFIYFSRVLSGAFDKVVKVWSQDGQVMHKFDGFRFVAFTRRSYHLLGIIYSKMKTTVVFFYMLIIYWPSMPQFQLEILLNSADVIHEALRAD